MKYPLVLGSILLLAPSIAQAQLSAEEAPSLQLPRPFSQTPSLDAFAGASTQLQLRARWVQISDANLPQNLPAWNKPGAWSHVATPAELKTLELLAQTGLAKTTDQQIGALNNQSASLSYPPFTSFGSLDSPKFESGDLGSLDDMIIPRDKPNLDAAPPYIPNLAKPESRLPDMAPMPNVGDRDALPLPNPSFSIRPQTSPELDELLAYKFQIRPTIIGQQIALDLRSLDSAENIKSLARADFGETVVFALPNIVEFLQSQGADGNQYKARRTFLLITPRLAPPPQRDAR